MTQEPMTPQELAERTLALSSTDGCIVIIDESTTANLRWANNTLTTNGMTRSRTLTVIATVGGAAGISTGVIRRSGVDAESLVGLVRAAEQIARDNVAAEDAQPLVPANPDMTSWKEPPAETSIGVFSTFAPALGEAFSRAQSQGHLLFGYASHSIDATYLASSTGLRLHHDQPTGYVEINGKSPDFAKSVWVGATTPDFTDLDVAGLDADLTKRLGWAQRTSELPAGRYETLLPPSAVADLMVDAYYSTAAREAHEGRSVYSKPGGGTRVGERLTEVPITLRSDPHAPTLEAAPFVIARASTGESSVFDNGLPLEPTAWIDQGVLRSLVQTRHSAQLTSLDVTPAIDNLTVESPDGTKTLDEMIASTDRGLLLTCLWYIRTVDPQTLLLTGLTRDGVFLVERGEVVGAVNNFRFNESPVDLLRRATEVGGTVRCLPRELSDYFTRVAMPPIRIADFNMSSVSPAS